jgi:thiamine pyrophosphate-dependent acetolactate synthase large subunit-like protein
VSRYFDRITRPEQLLTALPRAIQVLTDPAGCGPVTLALCQDTQAEVMDWPTHFFAEHLWHQRRPPPDAHELAAAVATLRVARAPLIVAGGGVGYSRASDALARFATAFGIPVTETQAGKGSLPQSHVLNLGASVWPEPPRRTGPPMQPMWFWQSAQGSRISPPASTLSRTALGRDPQTGFDRRGRRVGWEGISC